MILYRRLARTERYQIAALLQRGDAIRTIARTLGRSPSTISRELKRNVHPLLNKRAYFPGVADERAQKFQKNIKPKLRKIESNQECESYVRRKLLINWSPEQISGRMQLESKTTPPSYSTVYRFIYRNALSSQDLWRSMRKPRVCRIRRNQWENRPYQGQIRNRVWIDDRPKIVEERSRYGDYERDTVHGTKSSPQIILSIVDRRSRITFLSRLAEKSAALVHQATVASLRGNPHCHTITNDNGKEFVDHEQTAADLNCKVYFSHPYHSWERGTNENTNGLLRQYFPKGTSFASLTDESIRTVQDLLNTRPRKCLGYQTPLEAHCAS
jgi:IS30 family transposase